MELRQLRYFVAVAQALNFTKAAGRVRVAQPALSRQVRLLEEEMGVRLLERNQRHTRLTEPGRAFLAEACAVLEQCDRAVRVAQQTERAAGGQLNIGYVWGLFHSLVPEAIGRFRQLLPEVSVNLFDLTPTEQVAALAEGRLDAGFIGFADQAAAGLPKRKIGTCAFVAALPKSHPCARKARLPLTALANEPFLMISDQTYPGASHLVAMAFERAGFKPRVAQRVARGFTILGLVAGNGGVALVPESLQTLPHAGVVFRSLTDPPRGDLYLAWPTSAGRPVRDTFLSLFR